MASIPMLKLSLIVRFEYPGFDFVPTVFPSCLCVPCLEYGHIIPSPCLRANRRSVPSFAFHAHSCAFPGSQPDVQVRLSGTSQRITGTKSRRQVVRPATGTQKKTPAELSPAGSMAVSIQIFFRSYSLNHTAVLFLLFIIIDSHQQYLTAILFQHCRIIPVFYLADCAF